MIRCPNCGSSAQIKVVWSDGENCCSSHYKEYECGCGCVFGVTFEATEPKVIEMKKEEESLNEIIVNNIKTIVSLDEISNQEKLKLINSELGKILISETI